MNTKIEQGAAAIATRYKMTTDMPVGVLTPDTVETRLGTLRFFDGFPDDATIAKVFDNLDFQRAVQAYLQGLPAVQLLATRTGLLQWGPANRTAVATQDLLDSRTLFQGGNANTVYWWMWMDTHGGPVVLEFLPQALGCLNDIWSRWISDLGITGPDQGQGGKYLVLPPGYTGEIPDGYFVVRPLTFNTMLGFRTFLVNGDPKPGVERGKAHLRIYPLAQAANPPQTIFVNASGKAFSLIGPSDSTAFEYINQAIQEEPAEASDPNTLGLFASIGIKKGQPFAPDERMQHILAEAARVGGATARALNFRYRDASGYYYPGSAWRVIYPGGYRFERDGVRLWDAYFAFFYRTWGVTPAAVDKMVGKGSQYADAYVDTHGEPFDGSKTYRLHLSGPIPAKDFWSVILYDIQTGSMLQTDQWLPMVSSQTPGLEVNADLSLDVYFGPEPPAGHEANWVQTIPSKSWYATLRLYGPLEPWFDQTWRPGEFERIG